MWTVVYVSQDKAKVDRVLGLLDDNKIMTRLKSSEEDDLGANKLFEILVPNTELETAQDIIFDSELDR